jgi:peptidoglycan/LPS O-acetylase OafA/YrhL
MLPVVTRSSQQRLKSPQIPPDGRSLPDASRQSRIHFAGLDGLRAIAVLMVLLYHLFPGSMRGGFFGVDVFFCISGFLITALLLREHDQRGKIALKAFWTRRARRLLPALGIVVLVTATLGRLIGGDVLVGIGAQVLGAALFVSNWVFIGRGTDYFATTTPDILRNTWSLGVEEQFYLFLPLFMLVLLRFRGRPKQALPLTLLAAFSAVWMFVLSFTHAAPTRIYFGSDSHAFGLLGGAVLAIMLHRSAHETDLRKSPSFFSQLSWIVLTGLGLTVIFVLGFSVEEASLASFRWGFQLVTVATLVVIAAITRQESWAGQLLDAPPLRWVGVRSYGIYLWHWPLLVLAVEGVHANGRPVIRFFIGLAVLIATLAVSAVSFRYLEQPVRKHGIFQSLSLLFRPWKLYSRQRIAAIATIVALLVTIPTTVYAFTTSTSKSSAEQAVARGQAFAKKQAKAQTGKSDKSRAAAQAQHTSAAIPTGDQITAVGDSVMLASAPELSEALPGIDIDAEVSRGLEAGVTVAAEKVQQNSPRALVLGLGTNGPIDTHDLDRLREAAPNALIIVINAHAERDWISGVNTELAQYAAAHRGVVLADWDSAIAAHPDFLAGDGIHPSPSGAKIYASVIQQAMKKTRNP